MKEIRSIICHPEKPEETLANISHAIEKKLLIELIAENTKKTFIPKSEVPLGSGIIIRSGGSTGGPHQCLIPYSHLNQSAYASAYWLREHGINIKDCQIFNALPLNHISGLMAWWRSECWGSRYIPIKPSLMKEPQLLEQKLESRNHIEKVSKIISLVPTQLRRLIKDTEGIKWLQSFSIIWLGGALLPDDLASTARKLKIRLAPCYGATETTAMIAIQSPEDFLLGISKYSIALQDVQLRVGKNNRLEVKTSRLAKAKFINGKFEPIVNSEGWWESGDAADLIDEKDGKKIRVLGRIDTAINSGGETVYKENLELKLLNAASQAHIPIQDIFLASVNDKEWGQRLVALFRLCPKTEKKLDSKLFSILKNIVKDWPPYERPIAWHNCPQLTRNSQGKWESKKWLIWLQKEVIDKRDV